MALLRSLSVALMILLAGLVGANAQTASEYDSLLSGSSSTSSQTDGGETGLYDNLSPEDYEQVGRDLSMLSATQFSFERFRSGLIENLSMIPELAPKLAKGLAEKSPTGNASYFLGIFAWVLLFWAVSYLVEWQIYGLRIVGPWFVSFQKENPQGIAEKLPVLALRAALGIISILIGVVIVGLLSASVLDMSDGATQKTVIVIIGTVALARASAIIWRMVISPYLPDYRLPLFEDACAKKLFNWLWMSVTLSLALLAFCYWIIDLDVWSQGHKVMTLVATFLMVLINIAMVIANRTAISQSFLGDQGISQSTTWPSRTAAAIWAPIAISYFLFAWVVQSYRLVMDLELGLPLIIGAYMILLGMIVAYGVVAFTIARVFQRRRDLMTARAAGRAADAEEDAANARLTVVSANRVEGDPIGDDGDDEGGPAGASMEHLNSSLAPRLHGLRDFEGLARRVATIFAIGAGLYALAYIWEASYLFDDGRPLDRVEDIVDILLIGYILYEAVRIWIDSKIEEEIGDRSGDAEILGDEGAGNAATRLATLLPLFRNFLLFVIAVTIVLLVLLEMGVKVAPIFAGAGVVGLAIGFGAQTLIRDILSGAFFLFDDAFRKGEYIDVGTVKGTVEKISMRSFQLRHHLGALNTIPFGEIQYLTNFSRDWVMMKLPLRVTYDTDIEKVRKLIKKLGQELLEHPTEGEKFVQPLKSQGVYKMEDSAMILRVKFMTRPGDQWTTRKLVYSRVREVFEANDIKFAHREVTVRIGDRDRDDLTDEEIEAISGAAQNAVETADKATAAPRAIGDDR